MGNMRRHFRYDVEVPIYFEAIDAQGNFHKVARQDILPVEKERRLQSLEDSIQHLFETIFNKNSDTAMIFNLLNHRIDYLAWLQNLILDGVDPREQHDYKFRKRENAKQKLPVLTSQTLSGLIHNMFERLGGYIHSLLKTIEQSPDGKIYIFEMQFSIPFRAEDYVKNLGQLAEQNIYPAKMLVLLIEKMNIFEEVDSQLKLAYQGISDPGAWPVEKINLSAGGFSGVSKQAYPKLAHLNIFLKIEGKVIVCPGRVVRTEEVAEGVKVEVEFEFLSGEYVSFITHYLQHQEVKEAMVKFPEGR